jgi:hypothetical protein
LAVFVEDKMVESSSEMMQEHAMRQGRKQGIPFGIGLLCGILLSLVACTAWYATRVHRINARLELWAKSEVAVVLFQRFGADAYVDDWNMKERFWTNRPFGPIDLSGSKITDLDLATIRGASSIVSLNLADTKVTDTCLPVLATLPDLKYLNVRRTKVTANGLRQFSKDAPQCDVNGKGW